MDDFLVSIIIPTYQRPRYLQRAIESTLYQTYKNIEIIVVSDNDIEDEYDRETRALMELYSSDDRVKYLSAIGHKGGCFARNRGLEEAKGKYINFLDDDDIFWPSKIEKQVKAINSSEQLPAVVSCFGAIIDSSGNICRIEKTKYDPYNILYSELLCNLGTTSLNMIRADICKESGGFKYIESSQEHYFLVRIFAIDPTFIQVQEVLASIDQHGGQRVSNNIKRPIGTLKMTKIIESFFDRLTPEQITNVKLARMKADIYAYCQLKQYNYATQIYKERLKIKFFDIDNLKIPVKMLLIRRGKY